MDSFGNKNEQKTSTQYCCEKCNYETVRKSNYDRHLLTSKHIKEMSGNKNKQKTSNDFECDNCNKTYQTFAGLWKHKKKCVNETFDKYLIMDVLQQNKELNKLLIEQTKQTAEQNRQSAEQARQNSELHEKVIELCKNNATTINSHNTNNSHNKTFNLQFFLNETCKNAMNLTDFVNSYTFRKSVSKNDIVHPASLLDC